MANPLIINPISAFSDNYIWCIHDGCHAVVVDPGDPQAVMNFLARHHLRLDAVLITHHHHDHIGGLPFLSEHFAGIPIFGPNNPKIKHITHTVAEGESIHLPKFDLMLNVFEVPGHTLDHIAYYNQQWLFCGDTLFSAGCGRLFEGTPKQMLHSLQKLLTLPKDIQVYCTHEYTLSNLNFARVVEPNNQAIQLTFDKVAKMREAGLPSLPTSLDIEKQINPFLRTEQHENWAYIAEQTGESISNSENAFAAVRRWKDAFKG